MKISTRGRYAVRIMVELSRIQENEYVSLKELAEKQEIPFKYIEKTISLLVKNSMIESRHGKGGGYRLVRAPEDYPIGEILRITEGDMAPVACLSCNGQGCDRRENCKTLPMWKEFNELITGYFNSKTLRDLII
ncbi:MAG: Rrf2 family transcriptional regulator [Sphaerochaetaceae bacterium]|nr:Rrf2 family transcriptional regulator [Sphaerochaetaceae bacterium]